MKKQLAILLIIALLFLCIPFRPAAQADGTDIRVLISTKSATSLSIAVSGSYIVSEAGAAVTDGTLTVTGSGSTVTVTHSRAGTLFSGKTVTVRRSVAARTGGTLSFKTSRGTSTFLGDMVFTASDGVLQAVNYLPMSHYLYGVVAGEMNYQSDIEALKAQAVAAKNFAMRSLSPSKSYDLTDTSNDQAYIGYNPKYTNVIAAVDTTIGEALYYSGTKILPCYYCASNGSWSILPGERWSSTAYDAYYRSGYDEYDERGEGKRESVVFPSDFANADVSEALSAFVNGLAQAATDLPEGYTYDKLLTIDNMLSSDASGSTAGRIHKYADVTATAQITGADTRTVKVSFRFEMSVLRDKGFITRSLGIWYVTAIDGGYTVWHARYGHGVGMSQTGAMQMAEEGLGYQEILAYYYPNATFGTTAYTLPEGSAATPIPAVTATPAPTGTPSSTEAPAATATPAASQQPSSTEAPAATATPAASQQPSSTEAPAATATPKPAATATPKPDATATPAATATEAPAATNTPESSATPAATASPAATATPALTPAPTAIGEGEVSASGVNFRSGPSTDYDSYGKLARGTRLTIFRRTGSWYYARVIETGQTGYIYQSYVTLTGDTIAAYAEINTAGTALYQKASSSSDTLETLEKGASIGVYAFTDGYYHVKSLETGVTGYVRAKYVTLTSNANTDPDAEIYYMAYGVMGASGVNIRTGPSVNHASLGLLSKGAALSILALENGWYRLTVDATGVTGYVRKDFVRIKTYVPDSGSDDPAATPAPTATPAPSATADPAKPMPTPSYAFSFYAKLNANGVNFRSGPSSSSESYGKFSKYTTFGVYAKVGSWYRVRLLATGQEGYVYARYLSKSGTSETGAAYVSANSVSLRASASASSGVLARLSYGTALTVGGRLGNWYLVKLTDAGTEGYLDKSDLAFGSPAPQAGTGRTAVITTGRLNLRNAPTTGGTSVLHVLTKGDTVTVHSTANGWCYVTHDGVSGYCVASCVAYPS